LVQCLIIDCDDPFVKSDAPYALGYKLFRRERVRHVASTLMNVYYLPQTFLEYRHLWMLGFRGWARDADEPIRKKGVSAKFTQLIVK
jgi:hypothetical protein